MPSANKDRIRVNLHVDREIYRLVKAWSKFEGIPISRLFDKVFFPHVEKFQYSTPEEWRAVEEHLEEEEELSRAIESHEEREEEQEAEIEYWAGLSNEEQIKKIREMRDKQLAEEDELREKWLNALKVE